MVRLGLRLSLRSGHEALVRLLVTVAAVAIGVAILLSVLADFHAFQVTNQRGSWESTQGVTRSQAAASAQRLELWNYSNEIFDGRTIERLDVAALGPHAPVPPGVSKLPSNGQYYASPALAALLRTTPRDELGARFPGSQVGLIGPAALTGPDELAIFVGDSALDLAAVRGTVRVNAIATAAERQIWSPYFRYAFGAGALALLFPILVLIGTATRLAAARREERYAAVRLVGATPRQVSVLASVDAIVGAVLGTVLGIGVFLLVQPALADTTVTGTRYFADYVTPTWQGYVGVLTAVPVASAMAALLSLRRVRISPLGVSRKETPPAPTAWRAVPLLVGIILFTRGVSQTDTKAIGFPVFPGLLIILIGLVVSGPWLTMQAARLLAVVMRGGSTLLAARRLADNPKAAFRSVTGLVLAVFLGTVVAGLLPAVNATTATPSASALSNVLLDGFTAAPVCGNNVNCTGGDGQESGAGPSTGSSADKNSAFKGLPPAVGAALVSELRTFPGVSVFPIHSVGQVANPTSPNPPKSGSGGDQANAQCAASGQCVGVTPSDAPENNAIITCASLQQLVALGECAPGVKAVEVNTLNLIQSDNPRFSTQAIAGPGLGNIAVSDDVAGLYLQAVLVKVNNSTTLERVRTFLTTHTALSASGTAPRTFGEAARVRLDVGTTVERLIFLAVALTLLVAGCSLAVAVGGSLVERKRPFTLLRLSGTPTSLLNRVVLLEAALPLVAATLVAAVTGYAISFLTVSRIAPAGTPAPVLGSVYYVIMGLGLAVSLIVILLTLPLLARMTEPANTRFE
jgi:hypothetical protein